MKKIVWIGMIVFLLTSCVPGFALDLKFKELHKIAPGMSVDDIMKIAEHIQYTLFADDYEADGTALYIEKSGTTRTRGTLRQRIVLGPDSENPEYRYKDIVMFTAPTSVKGLGILSWSYVDATRDQDQWLWLPSLKKVRKISAAQGDDSFMGSDFTVEEITTRRYEDETYTLLGEEKFKGFTSEYDNQAYYAGRDCYKVECIPMRDPWYYSKRITWIDKEFGSTIYDEIYDSKGNIYKHIFKKYKVIDVKGEDYPTQVMLEVKDLRSGHKTVIINENVRFDQGIKEDYFSERTLRRSKW